MSRLVWILPLPLVFTAVALPLHRPPDPCAAAAAAFLQSLQPDQRQQAQRPFDDDERTRWHFVPGEYEGLSLAAMNASQRALAHDLLRSVLSSQGYLKVTAILALEEVLRELESRPDRPARHRDPERYWLLVFGAPGGEDPWAFRIQGHHVSLHFTSIGGELVAVTPAFLGANPHRVQQGPKAGLRVLGAEEDLGRALLQSLDAGQRQQALLAAAAPRDVILGPDRAADFLGEPKGLAAGAMTAAQREMLWRLVEEYAHNLRREDAEKQLARIRTAGIDAIHFAWAGSAEPGKPHYYRLHGPTFAIEYDNVQNGANHSHTVWRDSDRDFGADLLLEHHRRQHRR